MGNERKGDKKGHGGQITQDLVGLVRYAEQDAHAQFL